MEIKIEANSIKAVYLDNSENFLTIKSVAPRPEGITGSVHLNAKMVKEHSLSNADDQDAQCGKSFPIEAKLIGAKINLREGFDEYKNVRLISLQIENKSKNEIVINYILS